MDKKAFAEKYLDRIGFSGRAEINLETLQRIQLLHLLHVPFENLDIMADKPLSMEMEALYEKIVINRRGGICYELNSLFGELLTQLGFKVEVLAGQVLENEHFLVDVGFGDNFLEPLKFELNKPQQDKKGWFKLLEIETERFELTHSLDGIHYEKAYTFSLKPRNLRDFNERCRWFENDKTSRFRKNRLCSLERIDGRVSMKDSRLMITENAQRTEYGIETEATFQAYLKSYFGMVL